MKKTLLLLTLLGTALLVAGPAGKPAPPAAPARDLMRQKLAHAQAVLAGLATEDYGAIAKQAGKLRAVSQQSGWQVFAQPEYARHTDTFQRNVETLVKAAADRNLDAATLAYVKVTLNCVECHKYVRSRKTAALDEYWTDAKDRRRPL